MEVTLIVVRKSGELFFRAPSGLLFDRLTAHKLTVGGRLTIIRRSRVFDEGGIENDDDPRGYPHPAFLKLGHLYSTNRRAFDFRSAATRVIDADELREKDTVVITMPRGTREGFNFDRILRSLWKKKRELDAFAEVMAKVGRGGILAGRLAVKFSEQLARQPKEKLPPILRFRPKLVPSGTSNLPKPVRQILRKYLNARGLKKLIEVSFWRGPLKEGKRTFYIVDTNSPTMRTYHVDTDGRVVDKGCHYAGRWDGMG